MTTILNEIAPRNYWCRYCHKPTAILAVRTKYPAELMHFDVPYHLREHACEFEIVQCRHCKAEGLIVYGAIVKHWRKTRRWWSDLDGRIELAGSKRTGPTPIINVINEYKSLSSPDRIELLLSPHNRSSLKPQRVFEFCLGAEFQLNGYEVKNIGGPRDRGIDITASKSDSTIAIQCKRWNKRIPPSAVRDFAGALLAQQQIKRGIIVTIGEFTSEAIDAARRTRDKSILLVNGQGLLFMVMNFPRFEEEYLTKYQVKTAFSGPPPTRVAVSPQRGLIKHVCLVALRAIPDQRRPEVGKGGKHGYFFKRVRKDGRDRYYCLHTISGKVHEGSCEWP